MGKISETIEERAHRYCICTMCGESTTFENLEDINLYDDDGKMVKSLEICESCIKGKKES